MSNGESAKTFSLFKDPDKLVSDLNACVRFNISDDLARLAIARITEILTDKPIAEDRNGNPRTARPRERMAAIKLLATLQSVNLREQSLIAELKGLVSSVKVEGRVALDLDKLYRDAGIIDVDPIQQRIEQERNSGKNGKAGGNGNGKE